MHKIYMLKLGAAGYIGDGRITFEVVLLVRTDALVWNIFVAGKPRHMALVLTTIFGYKNLVDVSLVVYSYQFDWEASP